MATRFVAAKEARPMSIPATLTDALPLEELLARSNATPPDPGGAILLVVGDPPMLDRLRLDHAHPVRALLGFTAPPICRGIGVRCTARSFHLDTPDDRAPVAFTLLFDRAGRSFTTLQDAEGTRRIPEPPVGLLGDACRRALGLPTAPPPASSLELWLQIWLDRVTEMGVYGSGPLTWDAVVRFHPGCATAGDDPDPVTVAERTERLAEDWPWRRLRHEPAVLDLPGPPLDPALARWMDDGMAARWFLTETAGLRQLLHDAWRLLPADVMSRVLQVFTAAGVDLPAGEVQP
jgi:hypothetical protein